MKLFQPARALHEAGAREIAVTIVAGLSGLEPSEFLGSDFLRRRIKPKLAGEHPQAALAG